MNEGMRQETVYLLPFFRSLDSRAPSKPLEHLWQERQ